MSAMTRFTAAILVGLSVFVAPAMAQPVTDYLGIPGPITFAGRDYLLTWSSQPNAQYSKQEYLPSGQAPERYNSMVMVEFLVSGLTPIQMAGAQARMLNERKASDPLVNLDLMQNEQTGEVLLDFIVSSKDDNGEYIVEWNGYRYASATNGAGESGGMLFAISHRAYGNIAAQAFLGTLRDFKAKQMGELGKMQLPALR